MGPSAEEPSNNVATFAVTRQHTIDTSLVVEVPGNPPVLTPGLARALLHYGGAGPSGSPRDAG